MLTLAGSAGDPLEGSNWLSFLLIFPWEKISPTENPGSLGDFLLEKNPRKWNNTPSTNDGSRYSSSECLIEFQFLPQNVLSRFWGCRSWIFGWDFLWFSKKSVVNFGSPYYLRNKTWLFRATSRVTGFIHPNDVVDWMVDWWLMEPFLFNLSSRSSSRSNLLINLYICML